MSTNAYEINVPAASSRTSLYLLVAVDLVILLLALLIPLPKLLIALGGVALFLSVGLVRNGYIYLIIAVAAFEGFVSFGVHYYIARYSAELVIFTIVFAGIFFRDEKFAVPPKAILKPLAVFTLWVLFRSLSALSLLPALKALVIFLAAIVVFLLAYHLIDSARALKKALVFQIIVSFLFIALALAGRSLEPGARLGFLVSGPNTVGMYAYGTAAVAVLSFSFLRSRVLKILSLLQLMGLLYILFLTNSRASMLGFVVFIVLFLWFRGHRRLLVASFVALAAFIAIALRLEMFSGQIEHLYTVMRLSGGMTMRDQLWESGVRLIADYPIMGVGSGCIGEVYYRYVHMSNPMIWVIAHSTIMKGLLHNGFLNITAQFGLIGLGFVMWIFVSSARLMVVARRTLLGRDAAILWSFIVSFVVAYLVHGFFEDSLPLGLFVLDYFPAVIAAGALRLLVINCFENRTQVDLN